MAGASVSWDRYAEAWAGLHGGADPRQARPLVRGFLRTSFRIAALADRLRVRPGLVTVVGLLACLMVPVLARRGDGAPLFAAALVLLASVCDTADGALAVLTGRATRLGYVYDAIADRLGEACWLVALWLVGVPTQVALVAGGVTFLHEYARSRANAAGMSELGAVTLGERPTRVVLTVTGLVLATVLRPVDPAVPGGVATVVTATWVVLGSIGLVQLFAAIHHKLAGRPWPVWRPPDAERPADPAWAATDASGPASRDRDTGELEPVGPDETDQELLDELESLAELPAGSAVYTSDSARAARQTGRSARPRTAKGRSSPGKWKWRSTSTKPKRR